MNSVNLFGVAVLSCVLLMGLGYAGLLVSREATQQEKLAQRIEDVLSPHMRTHRIELSAFVQTPTVEPRSVFGRVADLFGFDPGGLDRYPLQWWMVLIIAAIACENSAVLGSRHDRAMVDAGAAGGMGVSQPHDLRVLREAATGTSCCTSCPTRWPWSCAPCASASRCCARSTTWHATRPTPTCELFAGLVDQVSVGVALDDAVMQMARRAKCPNTVSSPPPSRCRCRPAARSARRWKTSPTWSASASR